MRCATSRDSKLHRLARLPLISWLFAQPRAPRALAFFAVALGDEERGVGACASHPSPAHLTCDLPDVPCGPWVLCSRRPPSADGYNDSQASLTFLLEMCSRCNRWLSSRLPRARTSRAHYFYLTKQLKLCRHRVARACACGCGPVSESARRASLRRGSAYVLYYYIICRK